MVTSSTAFSRWSSSNLSMLSRGSSNPQEIPPVCYYLSLSSALIPISIKPFDHPWAPVVLGYSPWPNTPARLIYPHNIYIYIYIQIFICYVIEMTSITFVLMLICKFFHNKIGNKFNILKDKIMI